MPKRPAIGKPKALAELSAHGEMVLPQEQSDWYGRPYEVYWLSMIYGTVQNI